MVTLDLVVEREVLISGLETLEAAVFSFLALCFVCNMEYPKVNKIVADSYPSEILISHSNFFYLAHDNTYRWRGRQK